MMKAKSVRHFFSAFSLFHTNIRKKVSDTFCGSRER
jgi:hypothetical protein